MHGWTNTVASTSIYSFLSVVHFSCTHPLILLTQHSITSGLCFLKCLVQSQGLFRCCLYHFISHKEFYAIVFTQATTSPLSPICRQHVDKRGRCKSSQGKHLNTLLSFLFSISTTHNSTFHAEQKVFSVWYEPASKTCFRLATLSKFLHEIERSH